MYLNPNDENGKLNNTSNISSSDEDLTPAYFDALQGIELQKDSLQKQAISGIISTVDATKEMAMIK